MLAAISRRLHAADVAIAAGAAAAGVLAFDLFPGPTVLLALSAGVAGWVQARRGRPSGRMTDGLRIGDVARSAGVNVQTLRYYERRGLLKEPERRPSGYREYEPDAVRLVRFIKRA